MDLNKELDKCLMAEESAIPDRVLTPLDGLGENLIVLMYEVGAVCKDYAYNARAEDSDVLRARAANSITELQDVVCQSLIAFAKLRKRTRSMFNTTVEQFVYDGLDRQQHRMLEIVEKQTDFSK